MDHCDLLVCPLATLLLPLQPGAEPAQQPWYSPHGQGTQAGEVRISPQESTAAPNTLELLSWERKEQVKASAAWSSCYGSGAAWSAV